MVIVNQMNKTKLKSRAIALLTTQSVIATTLLTLSMLIAQISQEIKPAYSNENIEENLLLAQNNQERVRLAVMDFDYSSISNPSYLNLIEGSGRGVSDIVVNQLVESGQYRVIERSRIDTVLNEQNLGASGRVDTSTAAEIGRLLGVELVMVGSITQFDLQDRNTGFGFAGFGFGNQTKKALVTISTRLINTTTGEILMSAEGKSEVTQVDGQLRVRGIGGGTSTNNHATLLTTATQDAVKDIIARMDEKRGELTSIAKVLPTASGLVADVAGNSVIVNKGNQHGYRQGLKLSIGRVSREIKDPSTGQVIRRVTEQVGIVEINNVDANSSEGRIISGSGLRVGDIASPME